MHNIKTAIVCVSGNRYIDIVECDQAGNTVRTCSILDSHPEQKRPADVVLRERIAELRARAEDFNRRAGFLASALPPVCEDQGPETKDQDQAGTRDQTETKGQRLMEDQDPTPNAPARLQFVNGGEYGGRLAFQAVSPSGLCTIQAIESAPGSFFVEGWSRGRRQSVAGPLEITLAMDWARAAMANPEGLPELAYAVKVDKWIE